MDGRDDSDELFQVWRRAYVETPRLVLQIISGVIFVVQAFLSLWIVESTPFFLANPVLTLGLFTTAVVFCAVLLVYSLASRLEEIESSGSPDNNSTVVPSSERDTVERRPRITRQERMLIEEIVGRRLAESSSRGGDQNSDLSEIRDRLDRLEELSDQREIGPLTDSESLGSDSQLDQIEQRVEELEDSKTTEQRVREIVTESTESSPTNFEFYEKVDRLESGIDKNSALVETVYVAMKENVDNFEPPEESDSSEKSQEAQKRSRTHQSTETETELE